MLTLEKMATEEPFAWAKGFWPDGVLPAVRQLYRDAAQALIHLRSDGTPEARTAVLRRVVTELNRLDGPLGFIEAVERDVLIPRLEELADLVGLSNDDEELSGHRDW